LYAPVDGLFPLFEAAHEPLSWSFSLFDLWQHNLEQQSQSSRLSISHFGDFVSWSSDFDELPEGAGTV